MTEAMPYATPENQQAKPSTVGFMLGVLGLGLIFLAGCFLIGILILQEEPQFTSGTPGAHADRIVLAAVLYVFTFGCGGGGAFVLVQAVRKLLCA